MYGNSLSEVVNVSAALEFASQLFSEMWNMFSKNLEKDNRNVLLWQKKKKVTFMHISLTRSSQLFQQIIGLMWWAEYFKNAKQGSSTSSAINARMIFFCCCCSFSMVSFFISASHNMSSWTSDILLKGTMTADFSPHMVSNQNLWLFTRVPHSVTGPARQLCNGFAAQYCSLTVVIKGLQ